MDSNTFFTYQNWTFKHQQDGSLIIEPQSAQQGGVFKGGESSVSKMQPITIPSNEVYRLIGYCLTGDLSNTEVVNRVQALHKEQSLVGGQTR